MHPCFERVGSTVQGESTYQTSAPGTRITTKALGACAHQCFIVYLDRSLLCFVICFLWVFLQRSCAEGCELRSGVPLKNESASLQVLWLHDCYLNPHHGPNNPATSAVHTPTLYLGHPHNTGFHFPTGFVAIGVPATEVWLVLSPVAVTKAVLAQFKVWFRGGTTRTNPVRKSISRRKTTLSLFLTIRFICFFFFCILISGVANGNFGHLEADIRHPRRSMAQPPVTASQASFSPDGVREQQQQQQQ